MRATPPTTAPGSQTLARGLNALQLVAGAPAAYVCRGMVCDRPVTGPDDLRRALTG